MRLLALDVGDRRIGVAISDETGIIARPMMTIERASKTEDFGRIASLIREQGAQMVIVGHPLNRDGSVGPQARRIERYVDALTLALRQVEGLEVPVTLWDEYLSTQQAEKVLPCISGTDTIRPRRGHSGRRSRTRQCGVDAVAAAVILQEYLDARARGSRPLVPPVPSAGSGSEASGGEGFC